MRDPTPDIPTSTGSQSRSADAARATEDVLQRAQYLIHEVANLVDGSLREIELARRTLGTPAASADPDAIRHLDAARAAMHHIASIVRSGYNPSSRDRRLGAASDAETSVASLAQAIDHASRILEGRARARNIEIRSDLDASIRGVPADEMYAVVSNALRNSIDAIGQSGRIDIRARLETHDVVLEILDDGIGPPRDAARAFELGFSTKEGSSGVGLALAHEVITELRGTIDLLPRRLDSTDRPGAVLRIRYPVPAPPRDDRDVHGGIRSC